MSAPAPKSNPRPSRPKRQRRKAVRQPNVAPKMNGPARGSQSQRTTTGAAAAYAIGQGSTDPKFINPTRNGTRIIHRELVSSVVGTDAFTVAQSLALNPGVQATFPWLSTQAQGWEQYRFNKLRFCYYSRCSTNTAGSVMLIPDYDAADPAPVSEQIASAYSETQEEVPWVPEFCTDLRVDSMHPDGRRKYVRQGPLAANLDIKTYDVGNLFLATVDGSATNWGKLWVEYDVSLFVPQLNPLGSFPPHGGSFTVDGGAGESPANPFGTAPTSNANNVGIALDNASGITFASAGTYLISTESNGTGLSADLLAGSDITATNLGGFPNADGTYLTSFWRLVVSAPNSMANYTIAGTTVASMDMVIGQAPASSI